MYEYLEGRVASRSAARLVLDVGGVGYDLSVPLGAAFPEGDRTRVWTHQVVREDAHHLYGFPDVASRDLFRLLLKVRGVGPGVALALLSGLDRAELLTAITHGEAARLVAIKGVGKKTAEQILLDLRDRAEVLLAAAEVGAGGSLDAAARERGHIDAAVAALVSIGFTEKDAARSVRRAAKGVDPSDLELLVRKALQG